MQHMCRENKQFQAMSHMRKGNTERWITDLLTIYAGGLNIVYQINIIVSDVSGISSSAITDMGLILQY